MARKFPHLQGSTDYPNIDTVDVWEYRNTFDYSRWESGTRINVLKVAWDNSYENVPWWDSDEERDRWFDARSEERFRFKTRFQVAPDGTVKLPIPYGTLMRYDYLYVEVPTPTSASDPIDYASGAHRYYYFITDAVQTAPSTTLCTLELDIWTTWMHSVQVSHLMLERGHAPVAATDVDTFLEDPLHNGLHLLAPDVNFGSFTSVRSSRLVPLGAGRKYVLFATSTSPSQLEGMTAATTGSTTGTAPTYYDTGARNGYQVGVNGYEWGNPAGKDYAGMSVPSQNYVNDGRIPNGFYCYAVAAESALAFWQSVAANMPTLLVATAAMFVVPEEYFEIMSTIDVLGYSVHRVLAASDVVQNVELTRDMFAYPDEYADLAKLYTSPYAELEFTDDNGNAATFRVEQCGNLRMHSQVSLAYPYLRMSAFLTGVNGSGTNSYEWQQLNGASSTHRIWSDDFAKFMLNYDIPTYQLSVDAGTLESLRTYNSQASSRASALNTYQSGARSANTAYENSIDSNDTAKANSDRSALTAKTNTNNSNATSRANAVTDNSLTDTVRANNVVSESAVESANSAKINDDADSDSAFQTAAFFATAQSEAIAGATGAASGLLGGAISAASGNLAGSITGVLGGINAAFGSMVAITKQSALSTASQTRLGAQRNHATTNIANVGLANIQNMTQNAQATTSHHTAITNANATTSDTNAANTYNASTANSAATKATNDANAGYTRDTSIENGKAALELAQANALRDLRNGATGAPSRFGSFSGDPYPDEFMRRSVSLKVRTQAPDALHMAAAEMLRYGYYAHEAWDMSELCLMPHFTYWQAADVWVTDREGTTTGDAVRGIKDIFKAGVTVWQDPDEIGRVSIYENR